MIERRHLALAFVTALVLAPAIASLAIAQAGNTSTPTSTPTFDPDEFGANTTSVAAGDYSLTALRRTGTTRGDEYPGTRLLVDETPVVIQRQPPNPWATEYEFIETGDQVRADSIRFISSRYGPDVEAADYTLRIVFWQLEERTSTTENGETATEVVAANQTVVTKDITFNKFRQVQSIQLPPHYSASWRVTMWLEHDGERVDGAVWRFRHYSTRWDAAPPIDSWGDLGKFISLFILAPTLMGYAVAYKKGPRILDRMAAAPGFPLSTYLVALGVLAALLSGLAYFQLGILVSNAPWILGVLLGVMAFVGYIETVGQTDTKFQFQQYDLEHVRDHQGDLVPDAFYKTARRVYAVRNKGEWAIVQLGLGPALARYWTGPATIPDDDLETMIEVDGVDYEREFVADATAPSPLEFTPAGWEFDFPLFKQVDREPSFDLVGMENGDDDHPEWVDSAFEPATTGENGHGDDAGRIAAVRGEVAETTRAVEESVRRVNWRFIGAAIVGVFLGASLGTAVFGLWYVGAALGAVPAVTMMFQPTPPSATFHPGPIHQRRALPVLAEAQSDYDDAKTMDEARDRLWERGIKDQKEIERVLAMRDESLIGGMFGVTPETSILAPDTSDDSGGGGS